MDAAIEEIKKLIDRLGPDPRASGRQGVRAKEEHGAGDVHGEWVADAGGVAAQQVVLELHQVAARNALLREVAEPGIDAVDGSVAIRDLGDELCRRANELLGGAVEGDGRVTPGHADDVRDREAVPVDPEGRHR